MYELYNGDCLDVLKNIPDESIDLVVTDCPYHIVKGGCTNIPRKDETGGILNRRNTFIREDVTNGKIFKNNDIEFDDWLPDVYRVLKDGTHCYIMINARNVKDLQVACEKVGFKFQNILIWNKGNATPNRYYLNAYEMILMLKKGKARNINNMGQKNIFDIKNLRGNKQHPTEKPVELNKLLIENSSNEGEIVLDPFMGVGACGVACLELNRKFLGIEIDENYFEIARKRIEEQQNVDIYDDLD